MGRRLKLHVIHWQGSSIAGAIHPSSPTREWYARTSFGELRKINVVPCDSPNFEPKLHFSTTGGSLYLYSAFTTRRTKAKNYILSFMPRITAPVNVQGSIALKFPNQYALIAMRVRVKCVHILPLALWISGAIRECQFGRDAALIFD